MSSELRWILLLLSASSVVFSNVPCNNSTTFQCVYDLQCILANKHCDGIFDCSDLSDEINCHETDCYGKNWFSCKNGRCISSDWLCDGRNDCFDFSDEHNCTQSLEKPTCTPNHFQCHDNVCIPKSWVCDSFTDCNSYEDESDEICTTQVNSSLLSSTKPTTAEDCPYFSCGSECIPDRWVCDGKIDCSDGTDENSQTCELPPSILSECLVSKGWFLCNDNKTCISVKDVCDKKPQCKDLSDEGSFCESFETDCSKCSDKCVKSKNGVFCLCKSGYTLGSDGKTCEDVNECNIFGICSQNCINTHGSFECKCMAEYISANSSCVPKEMGRLFFSTLDEIRIFNLKNSHYSSLSPTSHVVIQASNESPHAVGISYDPLDNRVYWTDIEEGRQMIVSTVTSGENKNRVVSSGLHTPEDIAVDYLARNIYFTDLGLHHVAVCQLNGLHCVVLIREGVENPRALTLYSTKGILFYTDWGNNPKIVRANMDGSSVKPIITTDIKWPNGISIDFPLDRIFWTDAKFNWIQSSKLDGTKRHSLQKSFIKHPFSIAVYGDFVYWSDWEDQFIQRCNKFNGKSHSYVIREGNLTPLGLHISNPAHETLFRHPCSSLPCSHICLGKPGNGYTCKCPLGMNLLKDQHNCLNDTNSLLSIVVSLGKSVVSVPWNIFGRQRETISGQNNNNETIVALATNSFNSSLFVGTKTGIIYEIDSRGKYSRIAYGIVGDLTFDVSSNNLYWTDTLTNSIMVQSLSSGATKTILTDLDKPFAIEIIYTLKLLIFTESRDAPFVKVSTLFGTSVENLKELSKVIKHPTALAIQEFSGPLTIFVADSFKNTIYKYDWKSKSVDILISDVSFVSSLLIFDNEKKLLWSENKAGALYWLSTALMRNASKSKFEDKLLTNTNNNNNNNNMVLRLDAFESFSSSSSFLSKKLGGSQCLAHNGNCSDLCFNTKESNGLCLCRDGKVMNTLTKYCFDNCTSNMFDCGNGHCIPQSWRCDGKVECENGVDEINCSFKEPCHSNFQCLYSLECIPIKLKCDGTTDCADKTDEENCSDINCPSYTRHCADKKQCILQEWICDGDSDCNDGSDERNCISFEIPSTPKSSGRLLSEGNLISESSLNLKSSSSSSNESSGKYALGFIIPLLLALCITCFGVCYIRWKKVSKRKSNVTLQFRNPTFRFDDAVFTSSSKASSTNEVNLLKSGDPKYQGFNNPRYDGSSPKNNEGSYSIISNDFSVNNKFNNSNVLKTNTSLEDEEDENILYSNSMRDKSYLITN